MISVRIQHDVPLAPLTTLGLGGPAKYLVRAQSEQQVVDALQWAADQELPVAVLGGGSNLIVPDAGYRGLVIQMAIEDLSFRGTGAVRAGAAVPWEKVVDGAVSRRWAGLECLTGIPGSTGATPIQNVGAYGQEVAEVIERVCVIERGTLQPRELTPVQCRFSYRDSTFKRQPDRFVVTRVDFALRPDGPATVRYAELAEHVSPDASLEEVRQAVLRLRRLKSMVIDRDDPNRRSAGSFFLNPVVATADAERIVEEAVREGLVGDPDEVPLHQVGDGRTKLAAGWLIEKAGMTKGMRRGAFGVSTRHALALVHHGGGTTAELLDFAREIQTRVEQRFGVRLQREPRLLGETHSSANGSL